MNDTAEAVVIGAGIAGVSTAYQLTDHGVTDVALIDPRPPLSLTSDKSTECYRNWWPNQPMVGLMQRSIDLLETMADESGDIFGLSRRGYLFVTASHDRLDAMRRQAKITSNFGAGDIREHPGPASYGEADGGVDILDAGEVLRHHPYLTETAVGAVHVRRAGWFSAQQLGAWMLERSKERGARLVRAAVDGIEVEQDRVKAVQLSDGSTIDTSTIVMAAGPLAKPVAAMAGVDLPLFSELHLKVVYRDHLGVIPRDSGMTIWADPQMIDWSEEERAGLADLGRDELMSEMPIFCHFRPEGGDDSPYFVALWEYHRNVLEPTWPLPGDPLYPEVVMRGLTTMVPALAPYLDGLPESSVDGGYYTKTEENRPLVGPCGPDGFNVVVGLSGFGVMASAACGELAALHVVGEELPEYADAFLLSRYEDPAYLASVEEETDTGQL